MQLWKRGNSCYWFTRTTILPGHYLQQNLIRVVIWFPLLLQVTVCVRKLTCVCIISAFICMCGWWWDSSNRVSQGMPDFLFDLLWFHAMDDLFNTALTVGIHWSISFMICGGCIFVVVVAFPMQWGKARILFTLLMLFHRVKHLCTLTLKWWEWN